MQHGLPYKDQAFIHELQKYAENDYEFDSDHALRQGTDQDPNAKGTQREAFDGFTMGLREKHRHGYLEVPTGVGKTALFISLIKNYLAAMNGDENAPRVLIAVPSTDLVIQTAKAIAKFMPDIAKTIEADDDQGQEINWEASDIGVQYGKMKHAHLKPKVLITTYQSLAKDADKSPEDYVYPPSEYGFVVFDEGHNVTARKFGLAVDRFADSVQLAVTATPEYSEDKTVSKKLPHCHYSLSLAEAINRGDLCPVNPYLIKTTHQINKQQLEQYILKQNGRPLTKKQMETLLNHQERNIAAIKTYLNGTDPNTGLRFFGQTGMVFAGGIKHCGDFCRQFQDALNKPEYEETRDWLKSEGIAPIAYLHSRFPKEGLELTIDGKKKFYDKDQVKELHREGKILLLVSDKELKEGTDFPRDSVVVELVDRLSVVDTTQRFGRGFRLDPSNPEKRCAAINLTSANTFEIYKDIPQMLPIYAAEILEGAEFREPMKRSHLLKMFKNPLPDAGETFENSGFTVETNIDRVKAVSKGYKKRKEELDYPEITLDDLALNTSLPRALGVDVYNKKYQPWKERVEKEYATGNKPMVGKYPIERKIAGSNSPLCLHKDAVPTLAQHLDIEIMTDLPIKTEDDLALKEELPTKGLRISPKNPTYLAWRERIEKELAAGNKPSVGDYPIEQKKSGARCPICLHQNAIPILMQQLGIEVTLDLPQKTESDITLGRELRSALGVAPNNPSYQSWKEQIEKKFAAGEKPKIGDYPIEQKKSGGNVALYLNKNALSALAQHLDIQITTDLSKKTDNELTLSKGVPRTGLGISHKDPIYMAWREQIEKEFAAGEKPKVGDYPIEQKKSGAHSVLCLHEDAVDTLKGILETMKNEQNHSSTTGQKSIAPDSPHIKNRTGRTRSKTDDE